MHRYRWRSRGNIAELEHTIGQLRTDNIRLRHQLRTKQTALGGLELALHQRMERIDELIATIDKLREQNKRLDQEAEHLAQMVAAPLVDADAR